MQINIFYMLFAEYNCDAYGAGAYGVCGAETTGGNLSSTGYSVFIPVAVAVILITASVIYFLQKRRKR